MDMRKCLPPAVPGASLLEFTPVAGGMRVRCPGCCATSVAAASLVHEDGCAVYRQIAYALERFACTTERLG